MPKKSLLLIDQSQVLLGISKRILERAGYSVRCAEGFAGARDHLLDYAPDLIILERDLPDADGFAFCRALRAKSQAPIMFISKSKEDQNPAFKAGANDFLKKPFDYEELKIRLAALLNQSAAEQTSGEAKEGAPIMINKDDLKGSGPAAPARAEKAPDNAAEKRFTVKLGLPQLAVAGIFCVLAGAFFFSLYNGASGLLQIADEQTPLTQYPFIAIEENALPYAGTGDSVLIPTPENVTVAAGKQQVKILLYNPEGNNCYLSFEIVLSDSAETVYTSNLLKPGSCFEEILLSRGLEPGEYNAVLKTRAWRLEDITKVKDINQNFHISAK